MIQDKKQPEKKPVIRSVEGEGGVVHVHPFVAVGTLFRQPHALVEMTDDERETHQEIQAKAAKAFQQAEGPQVHISFSPEETIILIKIARYVENLKKNNVDKIAKEAEEKCYHELHGNSTKKIREMLEASREIEDAYGTVAQHFERASLEEHGLTLAFDKFDVYILLKEGRREPAPLDEIPDALLIKSMRHDGRTDSEIAEALERKNKGASDK